MSGLVSRLFNTGLDVAAFVLGNALFAASLPLMAARAFVNFWRRLLFGYTGDTVSPVNKLVLVTGCDSGIGRLTAIRLLQRGFTVLAGCLDAKAAQASQTLFAEFKGSANLHVVQLNVTRPQEVDAAAKYAADYLDANPQARFWAVVNNASVHAFGPFEFLSVETLQHMLDVNVLGAVRVSKAFLPLMRRQGSRAGGRLVHVGCVGGAEIPLPMLAWNGATKAAHTSIAHVMQSELASRFGIRSVIVHPDDTYATEMFNPDRLLASFNREVERARPEVLDAYGGQERVERMRQLVGKALPRLARNDPKPVVDAVVEGVASPNPRDVYYVLEAQTRVLKAVHAASPVAFRRLFVDWLPRVLPTALLPASTAVALMAGQWSVPIASMPGLNPNAPSAASTMPAGRAK